MQLILDAESSVDLEKKMSLSEDNLEKCVSDSLPGVKHDGLSNGDVTNGNKEAEELKETQVDKMGQIKESQQINSIEAVDNETKNNIITHIESNNFQIETSHDSESANILNGENETVANSEPIDQSNSIIENEHKDTAVGKNNTDSKSNNVETEPNEGLSENNVTDQLSENESFLPEASAVCNNLKSDLPATDKGSDDTSETVHDSVGSPRSESNANSSECINIKKDNDETAVSDREPANSDNYESKKETIEKKCAENSRSDQSTDIKEEIDEHIAQNPEIYYDNDTKLVMPNTEVEKTAPVSEAKETMETDNTEIDTSYENIDLIRLDVKSDICAMPDDSGVHETATEESSATNPTEKENLSTNIVTKMDVDESANNCNQQETNQLNVTPIKNSILLTETKNCEFDQRDIIRSINQPKINNKLSHDCNSSDVGEDKEKPSVNEEKADSTQVKVDDDKSVINCDEVIGDGDTLQNLEMSNMENPKSIDEIIDLDDNLPKDTHDSDLSSEENKQKQDVKKGSVESKTIEPVLKLSNTLNILSDDEEEQEKISANDSKCINIEDDDDVMLIDDDTTANENISDPIEEHNVEKELKPASPVESVKITEDSETTDATDKILEKHTEVPEKTEREPTPDIGEKTQENKLHVDTQKPLIPENFLKTCKKNFVDMTREELEEFCILRIVESILDRSNLSEIKNKLKVLTQNVEDYKKKSVMLSKQNRDLQVVLKSIQDDVKKNSESPIVPLKITRSVGMQVLMADKPDKRRRTAIGMPTVNKQLRTPGMQNPRPQKPPSQQPLQIPVPRLVPASNTAIKSPNTQQVNTVKVTSPLPNGVKTVSPAQKGEKRTHNRVQSVTVDLTDDEPPLKVLNRAQNPVPPVRLVPSQNLLAAPRTPSVNSPRKVYIPISGPQAQNVRPGQTIMLKTVPSASPRQRVPPPQMVRMPQSIRMARPQGLRHPAPLPECMKQYQPPNWKALPPAPDLKLAKVENGIVISWKIEGYQEDSYEEIASYQLYAYQETTSPPNTALWKKIGDVKALPLPMACTLTQFMAGYKYYFAVRAVDIRSRLGLFSLPGSILLLNKM